MAKKHTTIWKSYGMYDLKELEKFEKDVKEWMEEDAVENITEEKITDEVYFQIDQHFDDEQSNLFKILDGRILCIADMGLWNGRRTGYKILGNNLNEVLTAQTPAQSARRQRPPAFTSALKMSP